jgi:2-oxoglutarate ferredoxin oxidoreductase subunit gamma
MALVDDSLVTPDSGTRVRTLGAPATRVAEEIGKRIMANMVMVGLFTATTGLITVDAAQEAIRTSVPSGTEDVNLAAFQRGLEKGMELMKAGDLEEVTV